MAIQLVSATYQLDDDETINFLNAATGSTFQPISSEIESVEVQTNEAGEKVLVVVVGPKG